MYQKYFESVADRESSSKSGRPPEEYDNRKEGDNYREREEGHRSMHKEREQPQEDYENNHRSHHEYSDGRNPDRLRTQDSWPSYEKKWKHGAEAKSEDRDNYNETSRKAQAFNRELMDSVRGRRETESMREPEDVESRRHGDRENLRQRLSRERTKPYREERDSNRKDHTVRESLEDSRRDRSYERDGQISSAIVKSSGSERRYGDKSVYEKERDKDRNGDSNIDSRWKNQVLRADIERDRKREVSVKDRLSFGNVKSNSDTDRINNRLKSIAEQGAFKHKQLDIETRSGRDTERRDLRLWHNTDSSESRRDSKPSDPRSRRDILYSSGRDRHETDHGGSRERGDEVSESRKRRDHERVSVRESSERDEESNESDSDRKRHHSDGSRKKRKKRKRKREERGDIRRHKHKKKKKKRVMERK